MKQPEFSIIMPVMNQEDHIDTVLREHHTELAKNRFDFELIAVVNGSSDKSFEKCQNVAKEYNNVFAYTLEKGGYGLGILHGLKQANGKYLCYLNSARIHAAELPLALRYFLVNPNCLIHGIRWQRESSRKIGSFIYNGVCRIIFHLKARDTNGNPNIFSRATFDKLNLQYTDSMIDLELLDKATKLNIPIVEIPIFDYSRHGGQSTTSWHTIFRIMKEAARYWLDTRIKKSIVK